MPGDLLLMCMPYRQLVRKASDAGFRVISIWDRALESADYLMDVAELSEEFVLLDFDDEAQLRRTVSDLARHHDVAHVLHLGSETTQLAVCEQASELGLAPNPPLSVARLNDKSAMRRLLSECGLSPMLSLDAASPEAAEQLVRGGIGLPVVVKPTRLDGSRGVRLLERADDLAAWRDELARLRYDGPVLIEEYLRGPEVSVETLTANGHHHVVGITAKRLGPPPHFVEMGHLHPAPLPHDTRDAVATLVTSYLDEAGYRFGPAHTELILTAAGPRIVESQARIGGDRIPLLVELATGFDIEGAVFTALAGDPVKPQPARRIGAVAFFDFGSGWVRSIAGAQEVAGTPYVHALRLKIAADEALVPVTSSSTRHGHVVVEAASLLQAQERLARVRDLLCVEIGSEPDASPSAVCTEIPRRPAGPRSGQDDPR